MALRHFQCWFFGEKKKDGNFPHEPFYDTGGGYGVRESDSVKFPPVKGSKIGSSSSSAPPRRIKKKKWHTREDRRVDREYDVVLVPSDGVCLSGSESDDSDWSIGWLEPHGSDFLSDDETDDSFAVLVPCYRNDRRGVTEGANNQLLTAIQTITNEHFTEGNNLMEQWLSSLQNC